MFHRTDHLDFSIRIGHDNRPDADQLQVEQPVNPDKQTLVGKHRIVPHDQPNSHAAEVARAVELTLESLLDNSDFGFDLFR